MLSLHKASQIVFPGENVLDEARTFTTTYLRRVLRNGESFCMWNDKHDLHQEVKYALENPWHSSVPRLEAKRYCQVYRPDHAWLGKSIYKWFGHSGLPKFAFASQRPIEYYFTMCMGTFEPEFYRSRFQGTIAACLETILDDMYDTYGTLDELILFTKAIKSWSLSMTESLPEYMKLCFKISYDIVHEMAWEAEKEQGRELVAFFRTAWADYIGGYLEKAKWLVAEHVTTFDAYIKNGITSISAPLALLSGIFLVGQLLPENIMQQIDYPSKFIELLRLLGRLTDDAKTFQAEKARGELESSIECYMKDNPGSSEDDALNHVREIISSTFKEMTWEYLKPDIVPLRCKRYVFDCARSWMLIYKDGDGYGFSNKEIRNYIRESLIERIEPVTI